MYSMLTTRVLIKSIILNYGRQRKLDEERERKRLERLEAERRQKQEIQENKIRRVQLNESLAYFNSMCTNTLTPLAFIIRECG